MQNVVRNFAVIARLGWRVSLVIAFLLPIALASKKETEAASLLDRAELLSGVRADGAPAFRLKVDFNVVQEGFSQEGAYSEIWESRTRWRRETTLGDFRRTEVASGRRLWRLDSATAPERIADILGFFELSMPTPLMQMFLKPTRIEDQQIRGMSMRCIETSDGSWGTFALCFDKNTGALAAQLEPLRVGMGIAAKDCIFSHYQKFGGHIVAGAYQCYEDGHLKFQARVASITAAEATPDPALFAALAGAKEMVNCLGPIMQGKLIDKVEPRLPLALGIKGATVDLYAVIGTDGRLHELKVTSPPNPEFDGPALEAARQRRYKPSTCDGEPVEVETHLEVRYHRP